MAAGVALADWATKLAETQFSSITGRWVCLLPLGVSWGVDTCAQARRGSEKAEAPPIRIVLVVLALMPIWSGLAHWQKSEQRHLLATGHDMFTNGHGYDGKLIYPEISERDSVRRH